MLSIFQSGAWVGLRGFGVMTVWSTSFAMREMSKMYGRLGARAHEGLGLARVGVAQGGLGAGRDDVTSAGDM